MRAGAGPGWHGRSGVHTHMTNTRITDPEILERRYPVVLREFSLRPGSGGAGRWCGGDGVIREVGPVDAHVTLGIVLPVITRWNPLGNHPALRPSPNARAGPCGRSRCSGR